MTTMNRELREEGAKMAETSFMEGIDLKTLKNSIENCRCQDGVKEPIPGRRSGHGKMMGREKSS